MNVGCLRGCWRAAPDKHSSQLHLFEWGMVEGGGALAADGERGGVAVLQRTEAPSVMRVGLGRDGSSHLVLEGWEGGKEEEGLSRRLAVARRRAEVDDETLQVPMLFHACDSDEAVVGVS
jgi:hypothetical protein